MMICTCCDESSETVIDAGADSGVDQEEIRVMTWNLYLGTEINTMMNPDSIFQVPALVAEGWDEVQANDFPARAEMVADIIAVVDPQIIGLQEASLYRGQSPGDYLDGNDVAANEVWLDYLELLEAALADRELDYEVAVVVDRVDTEIPMIGETGFDDLRLTDRDAILVRNDVAFDDVETGTFETAYIVELDGGGKIVVNRGWVALDATVNDVTFRVANTHLEISGSTTASVQVAQGDELIEALSEAQLPLVLLGDLNSNADGTGTPTYGNFLAAGYIDAWIAVGNDDVGLTCCYGSYLGDPGSKLSSRIDYVFSRGDIVFGQAYTVGASMLTPDGLHPSDHLGVVATFTIP